MYIAATQYILGIKPSWGGLEIKPCLPEELFHVKGTREFRGCRYEITLRSNEPLFIPHVDGRREYTN